MSSSTLKGAQRSQVRREACLLLYDAPKDLSVHLAQITPAPGRNLSWRRHHTLRHTNSHDAGIRRNKEWYLLPQETNPQKLGHLLLCGTATEVSSQEALPIMSGQKDFQMLQASCGSQDLPLREKTKEEPGWQGKAQCVGKSSWPLLRL